MASSTPHTIFLSTVDPSGFSGRVVEEWVSASASAITPGQLVERSSATEVQEHSTANGATQKLFALENPFDDDNSTAAIDSDYAVGDTVRVLRAQPGDVLYSWLEDEGNVSVGDQLTSDGNGDLQAAAGSAADRIVAYAEEAVNNTGGSGPVRIRVRVA